MHLGRAFHLAKGLMLACLAACARIQFSLRAIQGKEVEKASGNALDLSFPEDSACLLASFH